MNKLAVSARPDQRAEKSWRVKGRATGKTTYAVRAIGGYYAVDRRITLFPNRIAVRDTFTNRTEKALGIIIRNHLITEGRRFNKSYLAGHRSIGVRRREYSPSVFIARENLGIGIVPLDDVYIVQSEVYFQNGLAGVSTDMFALEAKASYTLEWAVYPNGTGDYFDFTSTFRKDEGRIGRIEGNLMSVGYSMDNHRLMLTPELVRRANLKYAMLGCISAPVDDPDVAIEGIEFMDFPKEMAALKKAMAGIHAYPELKGMFHVAHSLYVTNKPEEEFPDSRVIDANGKQAVWPQRENSYRYISKERQAEGWQWWIFYPTPGNSFHDAFIKSVDVMMDDIGCRGVFTDGMLAGYMGRHTYDKWDGHTAEIDPRTKTIKRKMGSVILLSQPSVVEYVRRVNAKGGVVIANNCAVTRTIGKEKLIIIREARSPEAHLSQTPVVFGLPQAYIKSETDLYRDVLGTLNSGNLYFYANTYQMITHASLPERMYPITCEEIRSGYAKGPERIITTRSGVYGWAETADLCMIYHYDGRGVRAPHDFVTTVDTSGARTQVELGEHESAVLERIPVSFYTQKPVNVLVSKYDSRKIRIALNGRGKVDMMVRRGRPTVAVNNTKVRTAANADGELRVPLILDGETEITIAFQE